MVGSEYTVCPMCGGEDGQGCYADCPSKEISRLVAERGRLIDRIDKRDAEIKQLRAALHIIAGDLHTSWQGDIARAALDSQPAPGKEDR